MTVGGFSFQQLLTAGEYLIHRQDIPSMACVSNWDLFSEPPSSTISFSVLYCSTAFSGLLIRAGSVSLRCPRDSETSCPTVSLHVLSSKSHISWGTTRCSSEEISSRAGPTWRVGFPWRSKVSLTKNLGTGMVNFYSYFLSFKKRGRG